MAPVSPVPKKRKVDNPDPCVNLECSYEPITSLESLLNYTRNAGVPDSNMKPFPEKTISLSQNFSQTKRKIDGQRLDAPNCPKLLVCHDFCGGYLDDKFVDGTSNPKNYTFRHWLQTDLFVYFAHKLVTIPPLGWINSAHSHGVKILGTFITEWTDGSEICEELLKDAETIKNVVEKLTWINEDYGFDGYLINIENPIKNGTEKLVEFIDLLTKSLKNSSDQNSVIWYDSVIATDGTLKWQNELNELNKPFFDVCDGIYLNYGWKEEMLQNSVSLAGERKFDVFVGVDVFGRGCFGGGGLNTCEAVEKIAHHDLSIAIFAPGWTFETCEDLAQYPMKDDEVWDKCAKYFHFSCWKWIEEFQERKPSANNVKEFEIHRLISSDFSRGFGEKLFQLGEEPQEKSWFNLYKQSYQPLFYNFKMSPEATTSSVNFDTSTGCFGGGSIHLTSGSSSSTKSATDKICIPLDVDLNELLSGPQEKLSNALAVLTIWKKTNGMENPSVNQLKVYLEIVNSEGSPRRIQLDSSSMGQLNINKEILLKHFLPPASSPLSEKLLGISFPFSNISTNTVEKKLDDWNLTCSIYQPNSQTEPEKLGSILLGNEGDIWVGYFSVALLRNMNLPTTK